MTSCLVIKHFDITKYALTGFFPVVKRLASVPLAFEPLEETPGNSIVVAITPTTYVASQVV